MILPSLVYNWEKWKGVLMSFLRVNLNRVKISRLMLVRLSFAKRVGFHSRHLYMMSLLTLRLINLQIIGLFPWGFFFPRRWHTLMSPGLRVIKCSSLKNLSTISVTFSPLLSLGTLSPLKIKESLLSYWSIASVSYFCVSMSDCKEETVFCSPWTMILRVKICVSFSSIGFVHFKSKLFRRSFCAEIVFFHFHHTVFPIW